ncbi:MAG: SDR family NAD(P)-dependent oxidoreductase [Helicobacteraceae bacterium]|jgi:3-oxoacyl-[acyl-carrier protein] reductase|nr:SDR family NAD(P)-dependent oxidoreductase [Helicobacteraceae bacterium]
MRKVLVTGATGAIGEACVRAFADAGYYVYIHYRSQEAKAQSMLESIQNGEIVYCDVRDGESVKSAFGELDLDVLVNNAGITKDNLFFWMKDEEWTDVIDTNLNGMYRVTKAVVEKMIVKKNCAIVNVSSVSGIAGNPGQTNYSTTKGGIIAFTKALALELGRYKIRVNCVAPGLIESEMTESLPLKELKKGIPLRRIGKPEDVSEVVLFLADKASYITAETINISGGMVR